MWWWGFQSEGDELGVALVTQKDFFEQNQLAASEPNTRWQEHVYLQLDMLRTKFQGYTKGRESDGGGGYGGQDMSCHGQQLYKRKGVE